MMVVYFLLFAVVTVGTRLGIDYWLPLINFGEAWVGSFFAAFFVGSIIAKFIAKAWPVTEADGRNAERTGFWAGFSIEISGDGGGDGGGE